MRTAYSGRAAAYEKKGDHEKALADHKMAVLYFAIEIEILHDSQSPDRAQFLIDSARAYSARGQCLQALGRPIEAAADLKRASALEADANKLTNTNPQDKVGDPQVQIKNTWTQPVTLVVSGATLRLDVGEQKSIPARTGAVTYELQAGPYRASGTLEAGKTYTIRPTP
jgi:tetratricopeptide (TPR) repeat protein